MNRFLKYILSLLSIFIIANSYAQTEEWGEEGEIDNAQFVVEHNLIIKLPNATRKFEKIDETSKPVIPTKQKYDLESSSIELKTLNPRLRVLKIKADPPKPQLGNYAEVGFGNYITPYLGLYLNSTRNKQSAYGVRAKHISSQNGPVDYSGMSSTKLGLNGDYFMKNATLAANLDYNREGFGYYGFNSDAITVTDEDSIRQIINLINTKIGAKGESGNVNYNLNGIFSYLTMKNSISDMNVGYNGNMEYELADKSSIIVNSDLIIENLSAYDTLNKSRTYFTLNPSYKFLHDGIHITAGLNTAFDDDTLNKGGGFHIYPHVFFNYPLFVNEINVFAGITGGIERNSLTSILQENRLFLPEQNFIFNNNNTIEFFGGLKGNFNQKLGYKAQLSYKNYKNLHFFINNPGDSTYFSLITDNGNTSLLTFTGEVSYEISNILTSSLDVEYNSYGLSNLDAAYFRPTMITGLNIGYNVMDKATIKTQFNYIQGLKGFNINDGKIVSLDDIIDLNIEFDYKFSDNFSSFVLLNNVIGTKYQNYLNYPTKGFNVILGVSYSF